MKLIDFFLFEAGGGTTPGLRPGADGGGDHKWPHHGLFGKYGGGKPKAPDTAPYPDPDSDLMAGDMAAMEEPIEPDLPESMSLEELFRYEL